MPAKRAFVLVVVFSALTLFAGAALAQSAIDDVHVAPRQTVNLAAASYPADFGPAGLIRSHADLVLVPVSITDDRDRPILGLNQDNFQLFEGKKAQQIKNFSSEDTPVSVGILVDVSGSMSYKLDRARDAVRQFCEAANPQDEFFLIAFSDRPRLATDFTTSTEQLANDLLTTVSKGETSLLDAIYLGVRKMRDAHYGRKALLILSDGGDNHSRYSERDVKSAIRESDIMVYTVGTFDRWVSTQEEMLGPELLRDVADMTGGRAFSLTSANDMAAVTKHIGVQLRHQYMLAYQPQAESHDGKWRKIRVKLRLPKHLPFMHVEARPGYYSSGE